MRWRRGRVEGGWGGVGRNSIVLRKDVQDML